MPRNIAALISMVRGPLRWLIAPTKFLAAVNVIVSGIGFVQGLVTARVLGVEAYGVIAIIAGMNSAVLNFLDIRLGDLAAKLYYKPVIADPSARAYRASVLQICLIGNGVISLALGGLGLLANLLCIRFFTTSPVKTEWLAAQTLILAITNWANTFGYLQRFSGHFYLMGIGALVNRIITMILFFAIFLSTRDITGYYHATLWAQALGLGLMISLAILMWQILDRLPFIRRLALSAWADYRREGRFLFYGNLLGYVKMLHRTADILFIGLIADDRVTGLYKFARSLTDALYVLYDALNQVYYPILMKLLADKGREEYRRLAARLFAGGSVFTTIAVVLQIFFLAPLLQIALANRFAGAESAIIVMTIPFVFVTGVSTWLWPLFVHSGRLGKFTAFALIACLAQYVVSSGLALIWLPTPLIGAVGYLAYYLVLFPLAYFTAQRTNALYLPNWRGQKTR